MRSRKKLDDLQGKLEKLEKRVFQLECKHTDTELKEQSYMFTMTDLEVNHLDYREQCVTCGKVVRIFSSRFEFLKEKLKRQKDVCSLETQSLECEIEAILSREKLDEEAGD